MRLRRDKVYNYNMDLGTLKSESKGDSRGPNPRAKSVKAAPGKNGMWILNWVWQVLLSMLAGGTEVPAECPVLSCR